MTNDRNLALLGGSAVIPEGPPGWPPADQEILAALQAAYADGSWGRYDGPHTTQLSQMLSQWLDVPHVLLCSSGTIAVELALRGLGIGAGHEVILAGYDFSGNFRSIEAVGARPVLVDIEWETWSLDPEQLESARSAATRAIIVSHLHGGTADLPRICQWAAEHEIAVIEDACQQPGAMIAGRLAGTWGDVGVFSFGGSKLLTAGRGGAMVSRQPEVHQRAKIFCDRGNEAFPLSQLQAAVLLPQLERLEQRNQQRQGNVARLLDHLAPLSCLRPVQQRPADRPCYYKVAWHYDAQQCGNWPREQFLRALRAEGVAMDAGFRGFTRRGVARCRRAGPLLSSSHAAEDTLLLHHPVLLRDDLIEPIAAAIEKVVCYCREKPMRNGADEVLANQ